jgi:Mannosyl-glycoprotein endo-beta-N-acetylglucosaminidase
MRKVTLIAALLAAFNIAQANTPTVLIGEYVSQYLDIASYESARIGIPVSIILGQGIMESECGTSKLARNANNHFGIKWKSEADGEFVLQHDDDKDKYGRPISSKFVRYTSVKESFIRHSDFLKNRERYQILFQYDRTDYKHWALGLSKCGYATDPNYATKLISIIEKYQLYNYDIPSVLSFDDEDSNTPQYETPIAYTSNNETEKEELFEISAQTQIETRPSEMWETKAPRAKADDNSENGLFEIMIDEKPLQSKSKQSMVQQPKRATQAAAKKENN